MYSIFIPFLSKSKCIQRCLNALHENSVHKHEIVTTIGETDVYYAFNEGVYKCKYDTVVFLNDDMIVGPGWDEFIPEYAHPNYILTTYVYEKYARDVVIGPSPIQADFGREDDFDRDGFFQFAQKRKNEVLDFTDGAQGWYMPMIVNKKTYIGFPNTVKFPLCANDYLMFNMIENLATEYKFGMINSHVYHFANASNRS